MNEFLQSTAAFAGQFRFSDIPFPETMEQWIHTLTTPFSITLFAAGFFGLLVGWFLGRSVRKSDSGDAGPAPEASARDDLQWRHEKLVLLERQEADLYDRLQDVACGMPDSDEAIAQEIKWKLFSLAEQLRQRRQRVGGDLSRLECVQDRLIRFCSSDSPRLEAVAMCEEMAESRIVRLEEVREQLREPASAIIAIEQGFDANAPFTGEVRDELVESLSRWEEPIRSLPNDLDLLTNETEDRIRDLLKSGNEPEFGSILRVLLVDGAVTSSRKNRDGVPRQQLRRLLDRLREWNPAPPAADSAEKTDAHEYKLSLPIGPLSPDQGFHPPIPTAENGNGNRNGKGVDPAGGEVSGEPEPSAEDGMIVFRSNRAEDWGRTLYRGRNRRARTVDTVPSWVEWISLERTDTGEKVFAPVSTYLTSAEDTAVSFGFNASREKFYGAHHLGVFSDTCPNEVETRFTYGGWGFGHRVTGMGESRDDPQASGWAGQEIPSDTVFEIRFHSTLPEVSPDDLVLRAAEPAGEVSLGMRR